MDVSTGVGVHAGVHAGAYVGARIGVGVGVGVGVMGVSVSADVRADLGSEARVGVVWAAAAKLEPTHTHPHTLTPTNPPTHPHKHTYHARQVEARQDPSRVLVCIHPPTNPPTHPPTHTMPDRWKPGRIPRGFFCAFRLRWALRVSLFKRKTLAGGDSSNLAARSAREAMGVCVCGGGNGCVDMYG